MKEDHERIWLQNAKDAAAIGASREWCSAPIWPDDPGNSEPTEYVRADLLATARTEARSAALEEAAKLVETHQEVIRETDDGTERYTAPRKEGNQISLAYATAIRALIGTDPTTDRGEG